MQQKYYKCDKIRLFAQGNKRYITLIGDSDLDVLRFAQSRGYVQRLNDAARGGKLGEYFLVKRYFDFERMRKSMYADRDRRERALHKALKSVLIAERVDSFATISNTGCIVVDGEKYSNFYGDGLNIVDVCACDFVEFKTSEVLTRRQIYNPSEPISVVKFDAPKSVEISLCDCDASQGVKVIDNVCGLCIWERKMKIFIAKACL